MAISVARKHPEALCEECPLFNSRCALSQGPENPKVAVVSRSPGYHDVKKGKPFSGPSGKVLDYLLDQNGYKREEILVTNVVLCESDKPPRAAIEACSKRLQSEIRSCDTIIAAGPEAVNSLIGQGSIGQYRGYRLARDGRDIIATNNPALVLRDDSAFPNLVRDFKLALNPIPPPDLPDVDWTDDVRESRRWLHSIAKQRTPLLSVDIETKGLRATAQLVALGLSASGHKAVSFGEAICSDDYTYRNYIRPVITARDSKFIYHNGKFDVRNFRQHGIQARVDEDTMLLSWALDERSDEQSVHSLDYLLMNELAWPHYEPKIVKEWKAKVGRLEKNFQFAELSELPTPLELYEYNGLDVAGTAQLFPLLRERARSDGVLGLYEHHLIRASEALTKIELVGVPFDIEAACEILEDEVWPKLNLLENELRRTVGDENYNPNSSQQTAIFVYDNWNILPDAELPNERSVAEPVYRAINENRFIVRGMERDGTIRSQNQITEIHQIAQEWARDFSEYKTWDKQRSTYLESPILVAESNDGVLYTDYKLHNTSSGRLSSSRPNLQNITRTKPGLPNIRSLFYAPDGSKILSADYSQAELRCIAEQSDPYGTLARIYREGLDLHNIVAERFYGVGFTKEQRVNCKNMNFGVAYLQSASTFQEKHGIPEEEAAKFIKWWWSEFPEVRNWTNEVAKLVTTVGEVVSPFGHKRRFHLITRENRNACIREGINFLPQNIAANITLHAVCVLTEELDPTKANVVITVHDNIVSLAKEDYVEETAKMMSEVMLAAPKDSIGWEFPFETDMQIGQNWGELEDYEIN